ncbi:LysR family transcriptional regulator [Bradyrhizobium centrolobii]|uniref:LysR family transcriptional regulator n=1 Tax=Bradyrhizobium centrolobii TaxID=1505087 RepID=A0A176Y9C6_9BRAD|nr:DoxX family protein [Bradyrhizobium centrolobii]OAE98919.1 LysR family transcriptional regulator [Bradyrhizobium centrolobii]
MSTSTYIPALGRLLIALIFVMSGLSKIAAPANTIAYIQSAGAPFAPGAFAVAVIVEVIGGLALLVGFQTRLTAAALAIFTLAAAVLFHNNMADQNQMIHFLKNLAITGGLLQVAAFGAGAFSLDNRRKSVAVPA